MWVVAKGKRALSAVLCVCLVLAFVGVVIERAAGIRADTQPTEETEKKKYIKWVDFNISYAVMAQAMEYDISSHEKQPQLHWIELLAYAACKNGGKFKDKKSTEIDKLVKKLRAGETMENLTKDLKLYSYFYEAYTAVLGGFVGEYLIEVPDEQDKTKKIYVQKYGLKAFSPIARGYSFGHYDDFGNARSYGYRRIHLGNDLMGSVGAPIIAVEGGVIEALGWNQYGGWRIDIRSTDGKWYYYYAHLRKNHPYNNDLKVGDIVKAGDVIGYLGMTGYSRKENVNNIKPPHLHFGMQLIFDESQKDGVNQIWIDVYQIVNLLQKNKSPVTKDPETKEFHRTYDIINLW